MLELVFFLSFFFGFLLYFGFCGCYCLAGSWFWLVFVVEVGFEVLRLVLV